MQAEQIWQMESILDEDAPHLAITSILLVEHRVLRELMEAMEHALLANTPADSLRERAVMLEVALDRHATREEKQLLSLLRTRSERARHLVEMMEIVHDEVRGLFEEIQSDSDPKIKLWTILEMTEAHFEREEQEVFPLARSLMPMDELSQPVVGYPTEAAHSLRRDKDTQGPTEYRGDGLERR